MTTSEADKALAARFGRMLRGRREALGLNQDDLALSSGVGRRFIIELERGKPTAQLGKALRVAEAVGLRPFDMLAARHEGGPLLPDLPDLAED